jgi:mannose-6-phosphate isomerase-like protein (cupin superfamily)
MQRRSFLRTAAALAPAAGLHPLLAVQAAAQTAAQAQTPELHIVGDGQDRFAHPHSLGFSSILSKIAPSETEGRLFLIEHRNLVPGGPPLHLHLNQEEWFYVMEGEVAFQVGEQRLQLKAGQSVLAPRRVPHTFSSVSATPSRLMIAFCPAGKMEDYFRDTEQGGTPSDPVAYFRRYEMEYVGPSPFLKS